MSADEKAISAAQRADEKAMRAAQAVGDRLAALYADVYARKMNDAPICNANLVVESVGFRPWGAMALGIVVTPWFMNIVLAPRENALLPVATAGATVPVVLPAGRIDFAASELAGFGALWTCSLFSPMDEFADAAAARATAIAAMDLLTAELRTEEVATSASAPVNRRALMRGGFLGRGAV